MSKEGMVETIRALDIESSRLTALILKRDATIEDLKDALDAMFNERCERDAVLARVGGLVAEQNAALWPTSRGLRVAIRIALGPTS